MQNKRILISGSAGTIGGELVNQLYQTNDVLGIDINETDLFTIAEEKKIKMRICDIRDRQSLEEVFNDFQPEVVFHCGALKHVTPAEWDPVGTVKTNVLGTDNMVELAKRYGVKTFVNISTDKVVNAECIMGLTKKIAEKIVKNAGYVSVRFGNVLGSRGSVVPIWQKQLNEGEPITITDENMERYLMTVSQAVDLVIKAGEIGESGDLIILDMGKRHNLGKVANEWLEALGVPDYPKKIIGIRPGEQMVEQLMTKEEEKKAIKKEKLWIIK